MMSYTHFARDERESLQSLKKGGRASKQLNSKFEDINEDTKQNFMHGKRFRKTNSSSS